ncbi:sorting and assembly machinery component 50 homolog B [Schistocerca cancellata]|uniref:sorting and assembly machinery component 50 homolog B n=1 Tax=Schistocerca cancellata TaxID=274614 RepID=UPI002118943E|nr:sorting and assembly machinery component 50 homolog B [Schistocerca cancellata]
MGTVYAKEQFIEKNESFGSGKPRHLNLGTNDQEAEECTSGKKTIKLEGIQARVDKIHVDGLNRTKDDIVVETVSDLFKAQDFQQVLLGAHKVREKLDALGCFRNIGIYIDISSGPGATPHGLEVTFHVRELKRLMGGVNTMVGNNEGSLVVGLRAPNLLGRGEKVNFEYRYGSKRTTGIDIAFSKPLRGKWSPVFTTSVFQRGAEWPPSAYKQMDRGILLDLAFSSSSSVQHNLQWEGNYRDLSCLTRAAAFAVREQAGPTLKSSIRHIITADRRDAPIFPSKGGLFQLTTEFAGLGGNIGFLKNELMLQANVPLLEGIVIQGGVQGGLLTHLAGDKQVSICDRFFLGGPLNLRGFELRGAGPHSDGNALGADVYWAAAVHLYTPLPFRPGKGSLGDLFRTHVFFNCGNIGNFRFTEDYQRNFEQLANNLRSAYGLGVALRIGQVARLELNYCIPVRIAAGDRPCSGVQFGVGVNFL